MHNNQWESILLAQENNHGPAVGELTVAEEAEAERRATNAVFEANSIRTMAAGYAANGRSTPGNDSGSPFKDGKIPENIDVPAVIRIQAGYDKRQAEAKAKDSSRS